MDNDQAARRSYWAKRLDEAYDFMMKMNGYPVAECGEPLVSLPEAVKASGVEVVFSDRPHALGMARVYVLREGILANFIEVARRLNDRGWVLLVEDGFRTCEMQKNLGLKPSIFDVILDKVVWELDGRLPDPAFFYKRLLTLVAQIPKTGTHMSGSALDISVLDRATGGEVDRGGPYIEMSERTPMTSPFISPEAASHRKTITEIMRESGFVEYPYEFWHYSSGDAYDQYLRNTGEAARYGAVDYDPITGTVSPIDNPERPLNSLEELESEMRAAVERRRKG